MAAEGVTQLLPIPASRLHPKTKASIMHVRVMENLDAVQLSRCILSFPSFHLSISTQFQPRLTTNKDLVLI